MVVEIAFALIAAHPGAPIESHLSAPEALEAELPQWERRGRAHTLSQPVLRMEPGQKGTVEQGSRLPVLDEAGEVEDWTECGQRFEVLPEVDAEGGLRSDLRFSMNQCEVRGAGTPIVQMVELSQRDVPLQWGRWQAWTLSVETRVPGLFRRGDFEDLWVLMRGRLLADEG